MRMSKPWWMGTALAAALLCMAAPRAEAKTAKKPAVQKQAGQLGTGETQFITNMYQHNLFVIQASNLAMTKAKMPAVNRFARQQASATTSMNGDLKKVADKHNLTLPSQLTAPQQAYFRKLQAATGPEFDRLYLQDISAANRQEVAWMNRWESAVKEPDLKSWIAQNKTTVQHHATLARAMETKAAK